MSMALETTGDKAEDLEGRSAQYERVRDYILRQLQNRTGSPISAAQIFQQLEEGFQAAASLGRGQHQAAEVAEAFGAGITTFARWNGLDDAPDQESKE